MLLSYSGVLEGVSDAFLLAELAKRGYHEVTRHPVGVFDNNSLVSKAKVVVIDRRLASMARWKDGKTWSPSRNKGGFFVYSELKDGVPTGLLKKSVVVVSPSGDAFQIIAYYTKYMTIFPSTLSKLKARVPDFEDVDSEAKKYRLAYPPQKPKRARVETFAQMPKISLPPFSNITFSDELEYNRIYHEDIRQLNQLPPFFNN